MSRWKSKEAIDPTVERIAEVKLSTAYRSLRPLAELLIEWYERRLAEAEAMKGKRDNSN